MNTFMSTRCHLIAALMLFTATAHAGGKRPPVIDGRLTSANEIASILAIIPTTAGVQDATLADRLLRLNIDVRYINVGHFTEDEVKQSDGDLRRGDVEYFFSTTDPSESAKKECAIWSTFSFVRRGNLWIPITKTANYLANGPQYCKVP